MINSSSNS